jgi:transposase
MRSAEEKQRIVEETLTSGVSVAAIARRHGLNANLLFSWRRQHEQGVLAARTRAPKVARLLPVAVSSLPTETPVPPEAIELELPCGVRVRLIGDVVEQRLVTVLSALAKR